MGDSGDSCEVPMLEGCEDFHVYIAHSETAEDRQLVTDIKFGLEAKKFRCLDPEVFYVISTHELQKVEDGVARCAKVLIVITRKFLETGNLICRNALRKANERNDGGFILVALQDVREDEIPEEVKGYSILTVGQGNYLEDMSRLLAIKNIPEMAVLPADGIAKGLAWSYFYGYLKMLLPELPERYRKFAVWREPPAERVMPLKMFILIPASCYCPPSLSDVDEKFKLHDPKIPFAATRAGCHNRNYSTTVYCIEDDQDTKKKYYVQIEFATPVLSMWEMSCGGLAGMREQDRSHQLNLFYSILSQILNHSSNRECNDKAVLIYYDEEQLKNQSLSSIVLERIKLEITRDLQKEIEQRQNIIKTEPEPDESDEIIEMDAQTANKTGAKVAYLKCPVQEEDHSRQILLRYQLSFDTCKGKALIINVYQFDAGSGLPDRRGSVTDKETARRLWTDLNFLVEVVDNPTAKGIMTTATRVCQEDHSLYSAFVCSILSHGDLGVIYGCDGKKIKLTDITHLFSAEICPSLDRKPKMFFIAACQGQTQNDPPEDFHIYIATCDKDCPLAKKVVVDLEKIEKREFKCFDRDTVYPDDTVEFQMNNGVLRSKHVLLILKKSFLKSESFKLLCKTSQRKAEERNYSGFIILALADVTDDEIPVALRGYKRFSLTSPTFSKEICVILDRSASYKEDSCDALAGLDIAADANKREKDATPAPKQPQQAEAMFRARLVPGAKDFIMSYATLPGAVSYRHTVRGTFYMDSMDHCIRHYRNTPGMDLERILKKVSEIVEMEVKKLVEKKLIPKEQFPFHLTTTNKLLYLGDSRY